MNFLHMTYFIAIVDHQSISRAAQSLYITQQTLSAHALAMERELGCRLFERKPKFRLTVAGEVFYRYCLRFRELNEAMEHEFRDLKGQDSDVLRVGISQTRSQILMPGILLRMQEEHPHVQVHLSVQTNDALIENLLKGELDFIIGDVPDNQPHLRTETLYRETLVLVLPDNLLSKEARAKLRRTKDLRLLAEAPFVMNTHNDIAGRYGAAALEASGIVPHIVAISDSAETCLQMCRDGLGAYICPDLYVRFYQDRFGSLATIPLDSTYPICLARKAELYDRTSMQSFLQCCRETKWEST